MAGATPVFGIPYPELSDPIDPAVFAATATAIDTVLAGTDALLEARMRYPAVRVDVATGIVLAPATPALAVFANEVYDTHGMFNPVAPSLITCQLNGIYMVTITDGVISGFVSRTAAQFAILVNAVRMHIDRRSPSDASNDEITLTGPVRLFVGDQITVEYRFEGVGNASFMSVDCAVEFVCPLV